MVALFVFLEGLEERSGHSLPALLKVLDTVWMDISKVPGLGSVFGKIVEFPRVSLGGHQLPASLSQGSMALVEPPELLVQSVKISSKSGPQ